MTLQPVDHSAEISAAIDLLQVSPSDGLARLIALAEAGSALAMCNVGAVYAAGDTGQPDPIQAEHWYKLAESEGSRTATYALGGLYRSTGQFSKAIDQYNRAVGLGYSPAMRALGRMYYEGDGVAKDLGTAEYWWKRAAARKNILAMRRYGMAMASGGFGRTRVAQGLLLLLATFVQAPFVVMKYGVNDGRCQ